MTEAEGLKILQGLTTYASGKAWIGAFMNCDGITGYGAGWGETNHYIPVCAGHGKTVVERTVRDAVRTRKNRNLWRKYLRGTWCR